MIDTALATIPATEPTVEPLPFTPGVWPDRATICHANARGTGSAIRFELEVPAFATFDWANKICCKMGLGDLAQMLMVFRGMQESIQDGKGLFHRSAKANAVIRFAHQIEPKPGYMFSVSCKPFDGELRDAFFVFRPEEAVWFSTALEAAMSVLVFGVPTASAENVF